MNRNAGCGGGLILVFAHQLATDEGRFDLPEQAIRFDAISFSLADLWR